MLTGSSPSASDTRVMGLELRETVSPGAVHGNFVQPSQSMPPGLPLSLFGLGEAKPEPWPRIRQPMSSFLSSAMLCYALLCSATAPLISLGPASNRLDMERRGVDAVQITSDLNPASLGRTDALNPDELMACR